jgi:hypothetical protein
VMGRQESEYRIRSPVTQRYNLSEWTSSSVATKLRLSLNQKAKSWSEILGTL